MSQVSTQAWRGIATEDVDELPKGISALLRKRSRSLLADLLRPHRSTVALIALLVLMANLAGLAGPWLVGIGVDKIPALLRTRDPLPMIVVVAEFCLAILVQATASAY